MQYLSQRLANESIGTRRGERADGSRAATQRERLLAAAERLIAERGCAGTSIEAVVKAAGVATITFYEQFEDKEACFAAAFDRAVEETLAGLREAVAAEAGWEGLVRAGLAALAAAIEAEPARARMCLVEAPMGGAGLRSRYDELLDRAAAWLRRGRGLDSAPGELSDAVEEATVGGLAWLLRERLELGGDGGGGVGDLLPRMTEIALSPYLGDTLLAAAAESPDGDG